MPSEPPDPVDRLVPGIEAELRAFALRAGTRRAHPLVAHVGVPGGEHARLGPDPAHDACLRADLVQRTLEGVPDGVLACVWVTRPGTLTAELGDLAWLGAARTGFARHQVTLPAFFVVSRRGWVELLGGRSHERPRVRPRRRAD